MHRGGGRWKWTRPSRLARKAVGLGPAQAYIDDGVCPAGEEERLVLRQTQSEHAPPMCFEYAKTLVGIEAVDQDLSALGTSKEAAGGDCEREDGLVMPHSMGQSGGRRRRVCIGCEAIRAAARRGGIAKVVCHLHQTLFLASDRKGMSSEMATGGSGDPRLAAAGWGFPA
jgi:hypothetical protein